MTEADQRKLLGVVRRLRKEVEVIRKTTSRVDQDGLERTYLARSITLLEQGIGYVAESYQ